MPAQNVGCCLEHDIHTEIVLLSGILHVARFKKGMSDNVFTKNGPVEASRQFAGDRALTASRQAGHEDDHEAPSFFCSELTQSEHELYFPFLEYIQRRTA